MVPISNPQTRLIQHCIKHLQAGYQHVHGNQQPEYAELIGQIARLTLEKIAHSTAPYHNLEHTILVTLVGQEILYGKYLCEGNISCNEWLNFIVSLLCHDIGYLRGICHQDQVDEQIFITGIDNGKVQLSTSATDASLTCYHVDRGKQFVAETFKNYPLINVETVQLNIELTRFPVPKDKLHQDTMDYPGLARAADLIGQLSDPGYLSKLPLLFREFEETGGNKALGYHDPKDLRASYPKFYWHGVYSYVRYGIRYLEITQEGKPILATLYDNLAVVENELMLAAA
jgi:hypothetical protein